MADENGVVVTVPPGGDPDYNLIEVELPKNNAEEGRLFGGLGGSSQP